MAQKILLADSLAGQISPLLESPATLQFISGWYALLGYTGQLYFDFAGYSNMAIGLGCFLGFQFPTNFNSPYKATSIQDFWRRWHITLSSFLRDYLYIPLGGNRTNQLLSIRNLVIVMLLGGLWHGAGWNFVLWGAYHGVLLAVVSISRDQKWVTLPRPFAICLTFVCVMLGWLLFRSTDLTMAMDWSSAICGANGIERQWINSISPFALGLLIIALAICFLFPNANQISPKKNIAMTVGMAVLLVICVMRFDAESPFLYFQF
jgi:alginate O-acetyltransferase complex protein AlgI